jgi:hypothetical protein
MSDGMTAKVTDAMMMIHSHRPVLGRLKTVCDNELGMPFPTAHIVTM